MLKEVAMNKQLVMDFSLVTMRSVVYFFENNKTNLMAGAIDYGERRYGHPMEINEMGCVTMSVNMIEQDPDEYQKLKDFRTLWSNE